MMQASSLIPDDSSRYCHIPSSLEAQLMPFQREGVKFGLRHGGRCLIGDGEDLNECNVFLLNICLIVVKLTRLNDTILCRNGTWKNRTGKIGDINLF